MKHIDNITTVFFDVGSTLLLPNPPVEEVFTEIAKKRGHAIELEDVKPHMPEVDAYYDREYARNGDFWADPQGSIDIWIGMYDHLCTLIGLESDSEAISRAVYEAYAKPQHWTPYDDAIGCLEALRAAGKRMAIVSNWDPALESIIDGLGLGCYFETIACSAVVGTRKPDPGIFEYTLERLNVDPKEVVHVGDTLEADGEGALAVGITPVMIDRENTLPKNFLINLESLLALPKLVC